ncbi:Hydrogen peroxide-inducible genes activator [Sphingobium indicum BiD32]|uniref:Hydrogen peroxide-inducible genes activator n=1 Tax=Sphingobium indicum BiD32 TaxID=1301087 RepID=N1MGB4_9SPHN|nr:LysR family transcriptional regulator [Sphingobium indicum]CCW16250.1 Hydrogen peroxide-inducible genes activator [Sphingobium indicum BiD32]
MIERYLLRYFLAVVDQGNFSRAAAHCHVSQPTLSVGIAKLEQSVGAPLFLRSNQRVELTGAGARLLGHARRIEREFNLAEQAGARSAQVAPLRIGLLTSIPGALVAQAVAACPPGDAQALELVPGTERELLARLDAERIDVALTLVRDGADRYAARPIVQEGYGLALPASHALAGQATIAAEELAGEVMIVRRHCEALSATSRYFVDRGVRPHFAFRATNDERVMQMVAAGLGVTVMPMGYGWPGMARAALKDFGERRTVGLLFSPRAQGLSRALPPILMALEAIVADKPHGPKDR